MKFYKRKKKRKFIASKNSKLELNDIGKIELKIKEHLTIQVNKKKMKFVLWIGACMLRHQSIVDLKKKDLGQRL